MRFTLLLTLLAALAALTAPGTAQAQTATSTTYTIPVGAICTTVQNCDFHVTSGAAAALFETGAPWEQLDYLDGSANADYCDGGAVNWTSMPGAGSEVTWGFSCHTTDLKGVKGMLTASVKVHSVTTVLICGVRVRLPCSKTVWVVDTGSSVTIAKD